MVWHSMLYPPEVFNQQYEELQKYNKIYYNNPSPINIDILNQLFKILFKSSNFNGHNYLYMIDLINNYYSKDILIKGYNGLQFLIITSIFQKYNTLKKQFFVFPNNNEAESFYYKFQYVITQFQLDINIQISHPGIKNINAIQQLKNADIVIYTGGRFINNISYENINLKENTTYIFNFENFNLHFRQFFCNYFNLLGNNSTIINYSTFEHNGTCFLGNFRHFNFN